MPKAVQFHFTIPRYAAGLTLGKVAPSLLWSGLSCTVIRDAPEPDLPTEQWVRIQTSLGGICGTDLGTIHLHTSPYFSPFFSSPATLGHESVGLIQEVGAGVSGWQVGERVIVEPTLWCRPRGFSELCPACAQGAVNQCRRTTEGDVGPGLSIGFCRDTGGSWAPSFVAHTSQLYRVPEGVSDENALLVEPFACGLHAALMSFPADDETVLIIGAGAIGLLTLASLRVLGSKARILVSARYPFQAGAAKKLGADEVFPTGALYEGVAAKTGAAMHKPTIGKRAVVGGVDHVFECIGRDETLDDAFRLTRAGGKVTLVGLPAIPKGVDWSALFLQELTLRSSYIYDHAERYAGRSWRTFDLALHLLESGKIDLGWLVTHHFALADYAMALRMHGARRQHSIIKAVFDFRE